MGMKMLRKLSVFKQPQWNKDSKDQFGGILTLLVVPIVLVYVLWLCIAVANAPTTTSFEGVYPVRSRGAPLKVSFTCSASEGCTACPLPCPTGTNKVTIASSKSAELDLPFVVFQSAHFTDTGGAFHIGLGGNASADLLLGKLAGDIDVIYPHLHNGDAPGPSSKLLPTIKTKVDDDEVIEYSFDESDCPSTYRSACYEESLFPRTAIKNNVIYPLQSLSSSPTIVTIHCQTVCAATSYFKLKESKVGFDYGTLGKMLGQVGGITGTVMGVFKSVHGFAYERRLKGGTDIEAIEPGVVGASSS